MGDLKTASLVLASEDRCVVFSSRYLANSFVMLLILTIRSRSSFCFAVLTALKFAIWSLRELIFFGEWLGVRLHSEANFVIPHGSPCLVVVVGEKGLAFIPYEIFVAYVILTLVPSLPLSRCLEFLCFSAMDVIGELIMYITSSQPTPRPRFLAAPNSGPSPTSPPSVSARSSSNSARRTIVKARRFPAERTTSGSPTAPLS